MTPREFTEWNVYFDPKPWREKLGNTPEGRAAQLRALFMRGKNG